MTTAPKKVVLAYSGGLDTSIILKWLQTEYGCEVVTFTADLGQGEELEPARRKAELLGIKPENIYIEDLREEFTRDFVFPMMRANALYEGLYLLGTSIARPLISKRLVEIAAMTGADAPPAPPGTTITPDGTGAWLVEAVSADAAQAALASAVSSGTVTAFELVRPSLTDLFRDVVSETEEAA